MIDSVRYAICTVAHRHFARHHDAWRQPQPTTTTYFNKNLYSLYTHIHDWKYWTLPQRTRAGFPTKQRTLDTRCWTPDAFAIKLKTIRKKYILAIHTHTHTNSQRIVALSMMWCGDSMVRRVLTVATVVFMGGITISFHFRDAVAAVAADAAAAVAVEQLTVRRSACAKRKHNHLNTNQHIMRRHRASTNTISSGCHNRVCIWASHVHVCVGTIYMYVL